jgi:hypothetical protein
MTDFKTSSMPMDPGFMSGLAHMDSPPLTRVSNDVHPGLLDNLQYAAVSTRPYVSTALGILGSAHAHPTEAYLLALKKVVRYLQGTLDLRSTLGRYAAPLKFAYIM